MEFTARQIADLLNGSIVGDENVKVGSFSKIEEGRQGTITFLANPKYEHYIYNTDASIVLVNNDFQPSQTIKATLIKVENAYECLAKLLTFYEQNKPQYKGVSSLAYVAPTAKIGKEVYLAPFVAIGDNAEIGDYCVLHSHVSIGENAKIGEHTEIYSNAVIYHDCIVGKHCILHAGSVIGGDGFGFASGENGYEKIPQIGNVVLEDNVEIGANTTIDRAVIGSTRIGKGVKLDNLIQVAHNVEIGENTVMAAQVGIAGSTKIGKQCMFGGQVGIGGHLHIGDKTKLGAQSGVISNLKEGSQLMGAPAVPIKSFMRSSVIIQKLPEIYRLQNEMQKEIEELKNEIRNLRKTK